MIVIGEVYENCDILKGWKHCYKIIDRKNDRNKILFWSIRYLHDQTISLYIIIIFRTINTLWCRTSYSNPTPHFYQSTFTQKSRFVIDDDDLSPIQFHSIVINYIDHTWSFPGFCRGGTPNFFVAHLCNNFRKYFFFIVNNDITSSHRC